jgi:hypothetical protein
MLAMLMLAIVKWFKVNHQLGLWTGMRNKLFNASNM